jgi:hypothetical protein
MGVLDCVSIAVTNCDNTVDTILWGFKPHN